MLLDLLNCKFGCQYLAIPIKTSFLLTDLAKWSNQFMYWGCGAIVIIIIIIILCHLCMVILAASLMGATSYVTCILAHLPHKWPLSNLGAYTIYLAFWGIFITGTYFAVVWWIMSVYWFLMDMWRNVGAICRLQYKYSWTYVECGRNICSGDFSEM